LDGLWDDWEMFGIDVDGDSMVELDLPAMGANPMRKDIFVEIDFMGIGFESPTSLHSHRPNQAAIDAVVLAFANAPVTNPDSSTGITLHLEVGNSIPHQNALNLNCFDGGPGIGSFDDVKDNPANFGPNNPRRFAFHYALFTHQQVLTSTSSGCGEFPGNDFQVSLGGWPGNVGTEQQQAGTLMHELGHNLNLGHGGGDGVNYKPNYLSVMNYRFQTTGISPFAPSWRGPLFARVDYSGDDLPPLNENDLDEGLGIQDRNDHTRYNCSGFAPKGNVKVGIGTAPIDWSCDGDKIDVGVHQNVNGDCTDTNMNESCDPGEQPLFTELMGFDDWDNLKFDFQNAGDFEDGEHSFSTKVTEMDFPTHLQNLEPSCFGVPATIIGTDRNDIIPGTPDNDVIVGLGGNDVINGMGGNDLICGGDSNDILTAGSGNDKLDGGRGNDVHNAGGNNDTLIGGTGNDVLNGDAGNDELDGGEGNDACNGGPGTDSASGCEAVSSAP
jgi:hypothetical protein